MWGRQSICVHDRDNNAISISPLHALATRRTGSPLLSGTGGRVAPRPLPSNPGPRCVRRQRASRPVGTNGTCPPSAAPMAICARFSDRNENPRGRLGVSIARCTWSPALIGYSRALPVVNTRWSMVTLNCYCVSPYGVSV